MRYAFDEVDDKLVLLPMAARRALDWAGRKLSLAGWQSLELDARRKLVALGAADEVDTAAVIAIVESAKPRATWRDPSSDPPADAPPSAVVSAFGPTRPIHDNVWRALSPLDRFALAKIAEKARPKRLDAAYQELVGASQHSSHLAPAGGVRMVDVGRKEPSLRSARARSFVQMNGEAFARLLANNPKGDVLATARIAAILAAKKTSDWIPLCHPLPLTKVDVKLEPDPAGAGLEIETLVQTVGRTGVEMEALTAATAAALTVYDMLKAFDKGMEIGPTVLLEKTGGKGGDHHRS